MKKQFIHCSEKRYYRESDSVFIPNEIINIDAILFFKPLDIPLYATFNSFASRPLVPAIRFSLKEKGYITWLYASYETRDKDINSLVDMSGGEK